MRRFYLSTGLFAALLVGSTLWSAAALAETFYNNTTAPITGSIACSAYGCGGAWASGVGITHAPIPIATIPAGRTISGEDIYTLFDMSAAATVDDYSLTLSICTDLTCSDTIASYDAANIWASATSSVGFPAILSSGEYAVEFDGVSMTSGEVGVISGGTGDASKEFTLSTISHTTSTPENVIPYTVVADNLAEAFAGVGSVSPSVVFSIPTDAATLPDFSQWHLTLSNVSTTQLYRVDVEYQEYGAMTTYDDFNIITPTYPTAIIGKTQQLIAPDQSSTSWTATAYLFATTTTEFDLADIDPAAVLASSTITFTIGTTTTMIPPSSTISAACGNPPAPFFQLIGSAPFFSIGNPLDSISYGGCMVLTFGFIPSASEQSAITAQFSSVATVVSQKPPIGYFEQAIGDMQGFSVASSSSSSILDATSTAEIYAVYGPLDAGVASVIGFMVLLWFYNRGRHFDP